MLVYMRKIINSITYIIKKSFVIQCKYTNFNHRLEKKKIAKTYLK